MIDYSVTVTKVNNGFIVETGEEGVTVFEDCAEVSEASPEGLRHVQGMLYQVLEHFGYYGSKHDPARIRIIIEEHPVEEMTT